MPEWLLVTLGSIFVFAGIVMNNTPLFFLGISFIYKEELENLLGIKKKKENKR